MARAVILTVDDDPAVSQAVARDLRSRYASDYRIVSAHSGAEAIGVLEELARRDQPVALIVSDHRMPEMTGIEFLQQSRPLVPDAKLVLLTAYADTEAAITRHQRHRARQLPDEAVGPAGGPPLPGARRPARRVAAHPCASLRRRAGPGQPLVRQGPRHPVVPRPQLRALPVARAGARSRGPAPSRGAGAADRRSSRWCCSRTAPCCACPAMRDLADSLGLRTTADSDPLRPAHRRCGAGGSRRRRVRRRRRGCAPP